MEITTTLVTGPSRSGKSRWAEYIIRHQNKVTYIATLENNSFDKSII